MSRSVASRVRMRAVKAQLGFTLVELLVVIAIIGLLVGLTVPAVLATISAFEKGAVKFEVQALHDAVENYRSKYGDYPPDGSSWPVMERHLRKAFPNILSSELNLVNPSNGAQMDPAEALVFFLGGFSGDNQRPFTGKGGPLINAGTTASPSYRYNGSRENGFYEFQNGRLSLIEATGGLMSNDESVFAGATNDPFPVFLARNSRIDKGAPIVYFDSRTYLFNRGTSGSPIYNCYQPSNITAVTTANSPRGDLGAVRPYLASVSATGFVFENNKTFQIITPGGDGRYGGRILALGAQWFTTTGQSFVYNGTVMSNDPNSSSKFALAENNGILVRPVHDNASNFTELNTLGDSAQ